METNQLIVHESAGVCRITGRQKLDRRSPEYYVLSPLYDSNSMLYVPVESQRMRIRPVMEANEVMKLIAALPELETLEFRNLNDQKQQCAEILKSGDPVRLAVLTKTIYQRRGRRDRMTHAAAAADQTALRQAEKLLFGEIAASLQIDREKVPEFISEQLNGASEN